ncbi:hypothetical protein ACSS6W_000173 [Trichoderma asperelloides]
MRQLFKAGQRPGADADREELLLANYPRICPGLRSNSNRNQYAESRRRRRRRSVWDEA